MTEEKEDDHPRIMPSIEPKCSELKVNYENCFNKWYVEKYLKGNYEDDCRPLFETYQKCLQEALKEKKIDTLIEERKKDK